MMPRVGIHRTIRVGSWLTLFLFVMSASINATLDHLATSPSESQLAVFSPHGREVAVFDGDLARLQAADSALPRPTDLRRVHVTIVQREYRLL